ncbi:MAG: hypothetical protein F6K24_00200 [Okeania sp. SIO2D1]|nr:hypothetical protein [Okeania sp. SIO2D1]
MGSVPWKKINNSGFANSVLAFNQAAGLAVSRGAVGLADVLWSDRKTKKGFGLGGRCYVRAAPHLKKQQNTLSVMERESRVFL